MPNAARKRCMVTAISRVQLLGRQQRETVLQAKAHLPTEHRQCAGPGAIGLAVAVFEHMAHEVEVLAHDAFRQKMRFYSAAEGIL